MTLPLPRRLPGVSVTALPMPLPEALPRMDIAAFVGFAASGPVHVPVAVEDPAQFAAIFGADAPLAFDQRRGAVAQAALGPAVRSFFANGGRRCWVIRTANRETLEEDVFAIPGTLALVPASPIPADNAGTPGDDVPQSLPPWAAPHRPKGCAQAMLRARAPGSWADGLRLAAGLGGNPQPLIAADIFGDRPFVDCALAQAPAIGDVLRFTWIDETDTIVGLLHVVVTPWTPKAKDAPLAAGLVRFSLDAAFWSTPDVTLAAGSEVVVRAPDQAPPFAASVLTATSGSASLSCDAPSIEPQPGDVLWLETTAGPCWFCVTEAVAGGSPEGSSPPAETLFLSGNLQLCLPRQAAMAGVMRCDRLTLDLLVTSTDQANFAVNDLGCSALHAQYIGGLPDDDAYFKPRATLAASSDNAGSSTGPQWGECGPGIRFPLAALPGEGRVFVPLFLPLRQGAAASHGGGAALARDGLGKFDQNLFLDPQLAGTSSDQLMDRADAIRFFNPTPQDLTGIHAVLGTGDSAISDETTILAVPDAASPGWEAVKDIDLSTRPLALPSSAPECPQTGDFRSCADCTVAIEGLQAAADPTGALAFVLSWTISDPGIPSIVEQASREDFLDAQVIYHGAETRFRVSASAEDETYYRVMADVADQNCDWAAAIGVTILNPTGYRMAEPTANDADASGQPHTAPTLLAIHRALLRLCAARGDMFAVLSLPQYFSADDAINHAGALRFIGAPAPGDLVAPLAANEARALSYGALYHPWMILRGDGTALETAAPDGAACGVIAKRSLSRGAWIAPANEPLKSVVALSPALPEGRWLDMALAGVNVVRHDPRGFMMLAADTLSRDADVRPINVRRLLILVRRLALREGVRYVFEPNNDALRRAVERTFEGLLDDMFQRGAFAGATRDRAFRVACGADVNPPANYDNGLFLVEIRVAPSVPLQFLSVLLIQTGGGLTVVETGGA